MRWRIFDTNSNNRYFVRCCSVNIRQHDNSEMLLGQKLEWSISRLDIINHLPQTSYNLQRITSDASTILPIYFPLRLSSKILNLPLPLCIIFASIPSPSIDRTDQHERLSTALLKLLLLLSFNSSAPLYLSNLKEIVFITCLINCNNE